MWILIAFIAGMIFVLAPSWVVVVKGRDSKLMVEYDKELYWLVRVDKEP